MSTSDSTATVVRSCVVHVTSSQGSADVSFAAASQTIGVVQVSSGNRSLT